MASSSTTTTATGPTDPSTPTDLLYPMDPTSTPPPAYSPSTKTITADGKVYSIYDPIIPPYGVLTAAEIPALVTHCTHDRSASAFDQCACEEWGESRAWRVLSQLDDPFTDPAIDTMFREYISLRPDRHHAPYGTAVMYGLMMPVRAPAAVVRCPCRGRGCPCFLWRMSRRWRYVRGWDDIDYGDMRVGLLGMSTTRRAPKALTRRHEGERTTRLTRCDWGQPVWGELKWMGYRDVVEEESDSESESGGEE